MENNFYWNQGPPVNFPWSYDVQIPMGYDDPSGFHQDGFDSLESKLDMILDKLTDKAKCQPRLTEKFEQITEDHASSIFNLEMQVRQLSRELCKRRVEDCLRGLNVNSIEPYETLTLRSGQEHIESVDRPAATHIFDDQEEYITDADKIEDPIYITVFHMNTVLQNPTEGAPFRCNDVFDSLADDEDDEQMSGEIAFDTCTTFSVYQVDKEEEEEQMTMEVEIEDSQEVSVPDVPAEEKMKVIQNELDQQFTFFQDKLSEIVPVSWDFFIPVYVDSLSMKGTLLSLLSLLHVINIVLFIILQFVAYLRATKLKINEKGGCKPLIIDPG